MSDNMGDTPKLNKTEKTILLAIVMGTFMTALDATIVSVALPSMAADFGIGSNDTGMISWVLLGYTLMLCCFILLWGKLGSIIGYKKVFISGVLIFTLTSLGIGMVGFIDGLGLEVIIVLRMVQGLGAGMVMAMGMAMVSSYFGKGVRGTAMGFVTLAASAGTAFGPALGGVLTQFHWSYIFFINVPIGLICIFMSLRSLKEVEVPAEKMKLDYAGVAVLFIMMFALVYYLNEGANIGWGSAMGIGLIAVTLVMAFVLYFHERRTSDPILNLKLVSNRNILSMNITGVLIFGAMAGSYLLLPYYLMLGKGLRLDDIGTIKMGLVLIANSVGIMVSGPLVGRASDRTGRNKRFVTLGCMITAIGFAMMCFFDFGTDYAYILLTLFVMGFGVGMTLVASTNLAFSHTSDGDGGNLSGLVNTFRQAGSSTGVAILNAIFIAGIATIHSVGDGALIDGFQWAFVAAAVMSLIAMAVSLMAKDGEHKGGGEGMVL